MMKEKGVVLFVVLGTILIVIILGNLLLGLIASQSRLTHHQVSRIQAYYAAQAGALYAFDKLRRGNDANWSMPTTAGANRSYERFICRQAGPGCNGPNVVIDPSFPGTVNTVRIVVTHVGQQILGTNPARNCATPRGNSVPVCIDATTNYTYR